MKSIGTGRNRKTASNRTYKVVTDNGIQGDRKMRVKRNGELINKI